MQAGLFQDHVWGLVGYDLPLLVDHVGPAPLAKLDVAHHLPQQANTQTGGYDAPIVRRGGHYQIGFVRSRNLDVAHVHFAPPGFKEPGGLREGEQVCQHGRVFVGAGQYRAVPVQADDFQQSRVLPHKVLQSPALCTQNATFQPIHQHERVSGALHKVSQPVARV